MENRTKTVILIAILIIAVSFMLLWVSGSSFKGQHATEEQSQAAQVLKPSRDELNGTIPTQAGALRTIVEDSVQNVTNKAETQFSSLKGTLEYVRYSINLPISRWDLNSTNNEITFSVYDINNETLMKEYPGKRIGNYTVNFIHDTAFEKNRKETIDNLMQLREDPAYEIAQIVTMTDAFGDFTGSPANYVELWVYNSTPKNRELINTSINGWNIEVYPVSRMPDNSVPPELKADESSLEGI